MRNKRVVSHLRRGCEFVQIVCGVAAVREHGAERRPAAHRRPPRHAVLRGFVAALVVDSR
eukprot:COSAG06_NODE_37078_length_439_cov_1.350000_1_plen_59_part_01